jgi:chloramphenicol-sensitive protein RarD
VRKGVGFAFAAYFVWGMVTLFWKTVDQFNPFELIAWRITTSFVVLSVVMVALRRVGLVTAALRTPRLMVRISMASALLTVNWTMFVWAVINEHVVETALGYFISPILTTALGVVRLSERLSTRQTVAMSFAAAGLVILTFAYGRVPWIALAIAGSWSLYGYLKKKVPLDSLVSLSAEVLVLAVPAVVFLAAIWDRDFSVASNAVGIDWLLVSLTGTVTAVPLLLFGAASSRTPLSVLGPMQYIVPTIYFMLGWAVFDEEVSTAKLIGFSLIWVCLVLVILDFLAARNTDQPPATEAL